MTTGKACFWGCFLGLIVGCSIIALAISLGSGDKAMVLVSGALVVLTAGLVWIGYINTRIARQITWFTGAMERHSDQMRQMRAHELGIEMIWWDKTMPDAGGEFPFDGAHHKTAHLDKLYIGVPLWARSKKPGPVTRLLGGLG
ncbi:MAG TPA: hypothetical protein VKN76_15795 [Kiloniellaceae bacterium]|nr:hypothetical protein [Kiloniellaceae bacterium]